MHSPPDFLACLKPHGDERHRRLVSQSPEEFLEIHREHLDTAFFRRDQDVLDILVDRNQRTCLKVVIATVLDKMLDRLAGTGKLLDFIKNHETPVAWQVHVELREKIHEERVQIIEVFIKIPLDLRLHLREVNQEIGIVFVPGKLLGNVALTHAARTINHQGRATVTLVLPVNKFIVDFSSHINGLSSSGTRIIYHLLPKKARVSITNSQFS